eukprot:scaffold245768_cov44-Prasinocladus_malaysianus.AAC.1
MKQRRVITVGGRLRSQRQHLLVIVSCHTKATSPPGVATTALRSTSLFETARAYAKDSLNPAVKALEGG